MEHSADIKNLATALAQAQSEMRPAVFNAKNPFLKSDYADLGAVIEAAREPLATHGLSVSQFPVSEGDKLGIETVLMHASGEWISERAYLPITDEKGKSSAQVAGSVITYLRRYSLSAVLGIYADADTDGNEQAKTTQPAKAAGRPVPTREAQREPEWLEEIDQAPEAQAAKTLNLPEDHKFDKAKSNGKRTINFGKSTMFPTLMTWAQKQGYFEVGDKTIVPRLTNVLLGAGIEKFEDGALETYKQVVAAHYAAKAETNKA